jgi:hypothetical protein
MSATQCPFCPYNAPLAQTLNKHIKYYAKRPTEKKRKNHPIEGSPAYQEQARLRRFHTWCKDDDERDERRALSQHSYRVNTAEVEAEKELVQQRTNADKIRWAFNSLRYCLCFPD